jgi:hypothetical protein
MAIAGSPNISYFGPKLRWGLWFDMDRVEIVGSNGEAVFTGCREK